MGTNVSEILIKTWQFSYKIWKWSRQNVSHFVSNLNAGFLCGWLEQVPEQTVKLWVIWLEHKASAYRVAAVVGDRGSGMTTPKPKIPMVINFALQWNDIQNLNVSFDPV